MCEHGMHLKYLPHQFFLNCCFVFIPFDTELTEYCVRNESERYKKKNENVTLVVLNYFLPGLSCDAWSILSNGVLLGLTGCCLGIDSVTALEPIKSRNLPAIHYGTFICD